MKEPMIKDGITGDSLPFSQMPSHKLRTVSVLPFTKGAEISDHDFCVRYAAILLRERGA